MRQRDETEAPSYAYSIEDEEISGHVDRILGDLEPFPQLDLIREIFVTGIKLANEGVSRGDLRILRTAIKELRYGFKVFSRYSGVPKVSIFGSARILPDDPLYHLAQEFARRIADEGFMVITGAGPGIMAAGHMGAGRKRSFGLNILLPFEQYANEFILDDEKLINFFYFFTRKLFFVKESEALALFPGGFGTHDEGFEVLTLLQTGKNDPTPVVLIDRPGGTYWTAWENFVVRELSEGGYISPADRALYLITDNLNEACNEILTFYRRYHSLRYVNRKQKLVLRLKEPLPIGYLKRLNQDFGDLLVSGKIEETAPFPEESDEPELRDLPRLVMAFDRTQFSRLRQLIDSINRSE